MKRRHVEVICDLGMMFIDLHHLNVRLTRRQKTKAPFVEEFSYQKRDHLMIEQEKFYRSICHQEPAFISFQDGLEIVHLIDGVRKSLGQLKVEFGSSHSRRKSGEDHAMSFIPDIMKRVPEVSFFGVGGDELKAWEWSVYHLKEFSTWGIGEALVKIPFYFEAINRIEKMA